MYMNRVLLKRPSQTEEELADWMLERFPLNKEEQESILLEMKALGLLPVEELMREHPVLTSAEAQEKLQQCPGCARP